MSTPSVNFYHFTTTPFEKSLFLILGKAYKANMKAVVLAEDEKKSAEIDNFLWTQGRISFLPHCLNSDPKPERAPIIVTHELNNIANEPELIVVTNNSHDFEHSKFKRIIDLFDGNDNSCVEMARKRWKFYSNLNYEMKYWFQDASGAWQSK